MRCQERTDPAGSRFRATRQSPLLPACWPNRRGYSHVLAGGGHTTGEQWVCKGIFCLQWRWLRQGSWPRWDLLHPEVAGTWCPPPPNESSHPPRPWPRSPPPWHRGEVSFFLKALAEVTGAPAHPPSLPQACTAAGWGEKVPAQNPDLCRTMGKPASMCVCMCTHVHRG